MKNSKLFVLPLMMLLMISSALAYASINWNDVALHYSFDGIKPFTDYTLYDDVNNVDLRIIDGVPDYYFEPHTKHGVINGYMSFFENASYAHYGADNETILNLSTYTINYWVRDYDWGAIPEEHKFEWGLLALSVSPTKNYLFKQIRKTIFIFQPRNYTKNTNSGFYYDFIGEEPYHFGFESCESSFDWNSVEEPHKYHVVISDEDWHMFSITFDGIYHRMYIDGELVKSFKNLNYADGLVTNSIQISALTNGFSSNFYVPGYHGHFDMDELTIFKKALSPKQVAIMFEAYKKKISPFEYQAKVGSHLGMRKEKIKEVVNNVEESVKEQTQKTSSKGFFNAFFTPIKSFFSSFFSFLGI